MKNSECSISNIYRLDGRVPLLKAVPFGLQHILAMFVSNLTPITIIAAAGGLSQAEVAVLLQNAMLVAGIATLIRVLSGLEDRFQASDRHGCQLYVCYGAEHRGGQLRISGRHRRSDLRRSL